MTFTVPEYALLVVGHTPYEEEEGNYGMNYWAPRVTFKGRARLTANCRRRPR